MDVCQIRPKSVIYTLWMYKRRPKSVFWTLWMYERRLKDVLACIHWVTFKEAWMLQTSIGSKLQECCLQKLMDLKDFTVFLAFQGRFSLQIRKILYIFLFSVIECFIFLSWLKIQIRIDISLKKQIFEKSMLLTNLVR